MKLKFSLFPFALLAFTGPSLLAQTTVLNWDADGAAGVGGTGAWDTTNTLWNTAGSGAANIIWTTGTGASGFAANFSGTGGTVTVQAGGITTGVLAAGNASALNFDAGGYTITGGKITIDNTGGGNDRSFLRFASGTTTTINNAIDIIPSALGGGTFNRLLQARVNNSTITLGGEINILGTTAGTHTLDFINGGGATGVRYNLDGAIGDAAGAAVTRVRIGSTAANDLRDFTVRLSGANTFTGGISGKGKMLVANNSALGTTGMSFGGDGQGGSGALLTDGAVTIANNISSGNSAVSAITIGGNSAHVSSFAGNVDLSGNTAGLAGAKIGLQAVSGGEVTFSGLINDGAATIGMDKFGAGTVILSRAAGNTIDGPVNVVNGTLIVTGTAGTGTGVVTVGSAAGSLAAGATTNGSTLATVTTTAGMVIGQTIAGTNIPVGTYVEQIKNTTTIVLSQNATGTASGLTLSLAASNATLEISGSGSLANTSSVTLTGGTLLLGASDRIRDLAGFTTGAGGKIQITGTSNFTETVGSLSLGTGTSVIDFANLSGTNVFTFAASTFSGAGTLQVWNWSGTPATGGGTDQLFFGNSAGGLTGGTSGSVEFFTGPGSGSLGVGSQLPSGELVPVPEPSGLLAALGLLGLTFRRDGRFRHRSV
jgi:fibronectin-binding autotransporter adhesin